MVQVEGMGQTAPSPIVLKLTGAELTQLIREAKRRAEHRGYGSRTDKWGRGMTGGTVLANIGCIDSASEPIFYGLCGEYAVSHMVNKACGVQSAIDLSLLPGGDGGKDLEFFGLKIDVKTRKKDYGVFLVKHASERGRKAIHAADVFAFATWGGQSVHVHGFIYRQAVEQCPIEDGRGGSRHTNYEIQPSKLLPMSRLFAEIGSRKQWL